MVKIKHAERLLKALANKRRLAIIKYLRQVKESTVGDIAEEIRLSFKATSKHLGLLAQADIVDKEQRSLMMFYRLTTPLPPLVQQISNSLE